MSDSPHDCAGSQSPDPLTKDQLERHESMIHLHTKQIADHDQMLVQQSQQIDRYRSYMTSEFGMDSLLPGNTTRRIEANEAEIQRNNLALYGGDKELGVYAKVAIIWRAHVFIAASLGALIGAAATKLFNVLTGG